MALPIHLELIGKHQGNIYGSCDMVGRENTILVQAINQRLFIPYNPQDGMPTGKCKHAPISIIKETDKSSPSLYQALVTGEKFSKVLFKYYRISPQGNEEHYFTQSLEDAAIISIAAKTPKTFFKKKGLRHLCGAIPTPRKGKGRIRQSKSVATAQKPIAGFIG